MSQYDDGYRAGLEAAAKVAACEYGDQCFGRACPEHAIVRAIRSLSPPSPQPATPCPHANVGADGLCCECGKRMAHVLAPPPGDDAQPATPGKRYCRCDWNRNPYNPECPGYLCPRCGWPYAPPGDDAGRCGHERDDELVADEGHTYCKRCGAIWQDDGQGWRDAGRCAGCGGTGIKPGTYTAQFDGPPPPKCPSCHGTGRAGGGKP